jgi:tRNA (cytidine56-2'-O)-methyltransferase
MEIVILRLGHRLPRDERITTHVALVARAFGANRMIYSGQHDQGLESSVSSLVSQWGGGAVSGCQSPVSRKGNGELEVESSTSGFRVSYEKNFRKVILKHKKDGFIVLHLTMYAPGIQEVLPKLKTQNSKLLIVVGSEAVPGDIFELADYNVSVTNQPHSEVAALAIVLDRLYGGAELERKFNERFKGKIRIEPNEREKRIKETK